jgi:DNA-directed RNA polymerase subunit RPC12/RpoP
VEVLEMAAMNEKQMFPCPVCIGPREVKSTKKSKPYITCDPCGVQVFVRGPAGIAAFNRLLERANADDLWTMLKEMQQRYYPRCPKCGHRFWIKADLAETSAWDGSLKGFRCPQKNCTSVVEWEKKQ